MCSPKHLQPELDFLKHTFLGYPLNRILLIMDQTRRSIGKSNAPSPNKPTSSSLRVVLPYNQHFAKDLKKTLARYDIDTTFRTAPTLKNLLCNTSSKSDPKRTLNCIYKLSCSDCPEFIWVKRTDPSPSALKNMKHPIVSTTSTIVLLET